MSDKIKALEDRVSRLEYEIDAMLRRTKARYDDMSVSIAVAWHFVSMSDLPKNQREVVLGALEYARMLQKKQTSG